MSHEIILVVDDNRQISDFLAETVLPGLGYEVLVARDANSAIKMVKQHKATLTSCCWTCNCLI